MACVFVFFVLLAPLLVFLSLAQQRAKHTYHSRFVLHRFSYLDHRRKRRVLLVLHFATSEAFLMSCPYPPGDIVILILLVLH